jgi:hypothetical protein
MKNTITFIAVFLLIVGLTYNLSSSPDGAPSGYAYDKASSYKTCATSGCHSGTAVIADTSIAKITNNIPSTGYVPGVTYTFTATVNKPGNVRFGFQASPQDSAGNYKGTMIVTNTSKTKITGTKYITHTQSGNSQSSWSWNWVAPVLGSGQVKMSGALMAANNNGSTSGDSVYKVSTTINECFKAPTNIVATPKGVSVAISWTKISCATGYKIMYRAVGAATWKYITLPDTANKTIYALAYSTDYEYAIASINGTTLSAYSTTKYFTTYCQCLNPIVVVDSIGTNQVKFLWQDDSCGIRYKIQYRQVGKLAWITKTAGDSVNTILSNLLVANTPYEFQARRECNTAGTYYSAWNPISQFVTNPIAQDPYRIGEYPKQFLRAYDLSGKEVDPETPGFLIYMYTDGTTSKVFNGENE